MLIYISLFAQTSCNSDKKESANTNTTNVEVNSNDALAENDNKQSESETVEPEVETDIQTVPVKLNTAEFKKLVFNFEANPQQWVYEGDLPAIIDFYADWCKPCKMIAPTLEELQKEYAGKIRVYKVNTDDNPELSSFFQIRSIPALLFIPAEGQPQMVAGALPKESFEQAIKEIMLVEKPSDNK
ncbi:MAG: thioredoxin [Bacteroidales bacterium]|nr:thioredoxin [Bacteroidales bacterium]